MRDIVVGGVAGTVLLGLAAWAFGLGQSVGDLDARTKALDAGFEQTRALIQQNAQQNAATGATVDRLSVALDNLVRDSAEERQAARDQFRELRDLTRENAVAIRDLLARDRQGAAPP